MFKNRWPVRGRRLLTPSHKAYTRPNRDACEGIRNNTDINDNNNNLLKVNDIEFFNSSYKNILKRRKDYIYYNYRIGNCDNI